MAFLPVGAGPSRKKVREMEKLRAFLKRKNIEISAKRYGIDALGAMAQGLFCSLLIGTIIKTLGQQLGMEFLIEVGGYASAMSGAAMAVAIGYALKAPPLVLFSLVTVGYAANALGSVTLSGGSGAGGPLAVLFIAVIAAELGNPAPLLQIRLLAERNFGISMAVLTLFAIGMLGGTYLLPLYMQRGLGYTALAAGSMFLPVGVIQGVLSAVSGYLTRYVRPLLLSAAGILVMALSFWLASRFTLHTTHGHILFILYLRGFGMGLTFAPLNLFSLKNLTQQDMAAAAGISNSIKQLAGSIGIALLTVILSARTSYHAAHETISAAQTYVEGVTDALRVVAVITLAALLPLLWVFRKKRPEKSGVKGAATPSPGEAVSGKTDKTTIYRTKPE